MSRDVWTIEELRNGIYSEWLKWAQDNILSTGFDENGLRYFKCNICGEYIGEFNQWGDMRHDCR